MKHVLMRLQPNYRRAIAGFASCNRRRPPSPTSPNKIHHHDHRRRRLAASPTGQWPRSWHAVCSPNSNLGYTHIIPENTRPSSDLSTGNSAPLARQSCYSHWSGSSALHYDMVANGTGGLKCVVSCRCSFVNIRPRANWMMVSGICSSSTRNHRRHVLTTFSPDPAGIVSGARSRRPH